MNDYEQKFVINVKIEPIDIIHLQKVTFKTKFKIPKFNCVFLIFLLILTLVTPNIIPVFQTAQMVQASTLKLTRNTLH